MSKTTEKSLQPVFEGFRKLSLNDQAEYLKYLARVIVKAGRQDKKLLLEFKAKLEKEIL